MYVSHCHATNLKTALPTLCGLLHCHTSCKSASAFAPTVSDVVNIGKFMKKY